MPSDSKLGGHLILGIISAFSFFLAIVLSKVDMPTIYADMAMINSILIGICTIISKVRLENQNAQALKREQDLKSDLRQFRKNADLARKLTARHTKGLKTKSPATTKSGSLPDRHASWEKRDYNANMVTAELPLDQASPNRANSHPVPSAHNPDPKKGSSWQSTDANNMICSGCLVSILAVIIWAVTSSSTVLFVLFLFAAGLVLFGWDKESKARDAKAELERQKAKAKAEAEAKRRAELEQRIAGAVLKSSTRQIDLKQMANNFLAPLQIALSAMEKLEKDQIVEKEICGAETWWKINGAPVSKCDYCDGGLSDDLIEGKCPHCGAPLAKADRFVVLSGDSN